MQRQQKLPLGDANALRALWARFTDDQRKQVIAILAELITRAAHKKKEQRDDTVGE
jgi:predicted Fe-S protein YdhL (DUF1289 family)